MGSLNEYKKFRGLISILDEFWKLRDSRTCTRVPWKLFIGIRDGQKNAAVNGD
jgi:hypothetical protein